MSEAKQLARQWIEVWGRADPSTLPLAEAFVHTSPFGRIEGRQKYLQTIRGMLAGGAPTLEIRDIVGDGDQACVAYRMAIPSGTLACCDWVRVRAGRIQSVDAYYDSRELPGFAPYEP